MTTDTAPKFSLKLSEFKAPEQPKRIGRLRRFEEVPTLEKTLRDYPDTGPTQILVGLEPLNYRAYNNNPIDEFRFSAKNSTSATIFLVVASLNEVLGITLEEYSDLEDYFGKAFEYQQTQFPNQKVRPGERARTYLKFLRIVPEEEAAELKVPEIKEGAAQAQAPAAVEQSVDIREVIAELSGGNAFTKSGIADAYRASKYSSNPSVGSRIAVASGLRKLVEEGILTTDGETFQLA